MDVHCDTTSATLGYFFRQISPPPHPPGIPSPWFGQNLMQGRVACWASRTLATKPPFSLNKIGLSWAQTCFSSAQNKSSKGDQVWRRLLVMSLQQTSKHLASIKVCDGIQAVRQPRAQATRHTCTRCSACNYRLWDDLGKRGVRLLKLQQGYCKLSIIQSSNVQFISICRTAEWLNRWSTAAYIFLQDDNKTYFSHQSARCSRLHCKCRIFQKYARVKFPESKMTSPYCYCALSSYAKLAAPRWISTKS